MTSIEIFTDQIPKSYKGYKQQNLKIVVLGKVSAGKSTFLHRSQVDQYNPQQNTIGLELVIYNLFAEKYLTIMKNKIWDTSGQQQFKSITGNQLKSMDGVFLFISIQQLMDDNEGFNDLEQSIRQKIQQFIELTENHRTTSIIYYFLLSKMDLLPPQKYNRKEIELKIFLIISKLLEEWGKDSYPKLYQCTKLYGSCSAKQNNRVQVRSFLKRMCEFVYLQKTKNSILLQIVSFIKLTKPEEWSKQFLQKLKNRNEKIKDQKDEPMRSRSVKLNNPQSTKPQKKGCC